MIRWSSNQTSHRTRYHTYLSKMHCLKNISFVILSVWYLLIPTKKSSLRVNNSQMTASSTDYFKIHLCLTLTPPLLCNACQEAGFTGLTDNTNFRSPLLPRGGWHEADWDGVENGQNRGQVVGTPTSPGGDKKNREKSTEGRAGKRAAGATMAIEHFIDRYRQKKTNGEEDHNGEDANRGEGHLSENIPDKTWKVILSLG